MEIALCILVPLAIVVVSVGLGAIWMIPTWNAEDAARAQPPLEGVVEDVTISNRSSFYHSCTDIYIQIDDKIYILDVDDIPVPAEGAEVLYRAVDDRIIDLEEVDPDESGE